MVHGGTGSVEGGTGWYMVVLGQYGAESLNLDTDRPTGQICLFEGWKIEGRDLCLKKKLNPVSTIQKTSVINCL